MTWLVLKLLQRDDELLRVSSIFIELDELPSHVTNGALDLGKFAFPFATWVRSEPLGFQWTAIPSGLAFSSWEQTRIGISIDAFFKGGTIITFSEARNCFLSGFYLAKVDRAISYLLFLSR